MNSDALTVLKELFFLHSTGQCDGFEAESLMKLNCETLFTKKHAYALIHLACSNCSGVAIAKSKKLDTFLVDEFIEWLEARFNFTLGYVN